MLSRTPRSFVIPLGVIALFTLISITVGTRFGPGLTPDTVLYLETADSLRAGGGLPETLMLGGRPGSAVPPLYPVALAAVGSGLDDLPSARWLNVGLYGLNVVLFGFMAYHLTSGATRVSLLGTSLFATSIVMLEIHSAAWSEPLFITLLLISLDALGRFLEKPNLKLFGLACFLVALSPICRFAGVTTLAAGAVCMLTPGPRRLRRFVSFCVLVSLPLLALLQSNKARSGSAAGTGEFAPYIPWADIVVLVNTWAAWIVPGIDRYALIPKQDVLAFIIVLSSMVLLVWAMMRTHVIAQPKLQPWLIFTLVYPTVILTLITFVKADLPLEQRILCPMHVTVLMLVTVLTARLSQDHSFRPHSKVWLLPLALLGVYLPPFLVGVHHLATKGRGYTAPNYDAPQIYQWLKSHSPATLYCSDPSAAWLKLRRKVSPITQEVDGPVLFFRVAHPLPPRHEEGVKRPGPPVDALQSLLDSTSLKLLYKEGDVELYVLGDTSSEP